MRWASTDSRKRRGQCWDNAVSESWFGTYKLELVEGHSWPSIAKLRSATFAWIEGWYNLRRRHSTLGGISPANYEKNRQRVAAQAASSICPPERVNPRSEYRDDEGCEGGTAHWCSLPLLGKGVMSRHRTPPCASECQSGGSSRRVQRPTVRDHFQS